MADTPRHARRMTDSKSVYIALLAIRPLRRQILVRLPDGAERWVRLPATVAISADVRLTADPRELRPDNGHGNGNGGNAGDVF